MAAAVTSIYRLSPYYNTRMAIDIPNIMYALPNVYGPAQVQTTSSSKTGDMENDPEMVQVLAVAQKQKDLLTRLESLRTQIQSLTTKAADIPAANTKAQKGDKKQSSGKRPCKEEEAETTEESPPIREVFHHVRLYHLESKAELLKSHYNAYLPALLKKCGSERLALAFFLDPTGPLPPFLAILLAALRQQLGGSCHVLTYRHSSAFDLSPLSASSATAWLSNSDVASAKLHVTFVWKPTPYGMQMSLPQIKATPIWGPTAVCRFLATVVGMYPGVVGGGAKPDPLAALPIDQWLDALEAVSDGAQTWEIVSEQLNNALTGGAKKFLLGEKGDTLSLADVFVFSVVYEHELKCVKPAVKKWVDTVKEALGFVEMKLNIGSRS